MADPRLRAGCEELQDHPFLKPQARTCTVLTHVHMFKHLYAVRLTLTS